MYMRVSSVTVCCSDGVCVDLVLRLVETKPSQIRWEYNFEIDVVLDCCSRRREPSSPTEDDRAVGLDVVAQDDRPPQLSLLTAPALAQNPASLACAQPFFWQRFNTTSIFLLFVLYRVHMDNHPVWSISSSVSLCCHTI